MHDISAWTLAAFAPHLSSTSTMNRWPSAYALFMLLSKRRCCVQVGNAASPAQVAAQPESEAQSSPPQVTHSRGTNANELVEDSAGNVSNAESSSAHKNGKRRRGGRV